MKLRLRSRKQFLVVTGIVVLIVALVAMFFRVHHSSAAQFTTAKVNTGAIRCLVTATGSLQAVNTVQVGSQISGTVSALNADFNSQVTKGQVLSKASN